MKESAKRITHIFIGIIVFALVVVLLPGTMFSREAALSLALILLMVYWWITRPVHIAVTALLPILVNSLFGVAPMNTVLDDYFSPIVVLLLGAGIFVACWKRSGLDRRIALRALTIMGTSVRLQLILWFLLSTVLSMFLPNAVVAATLCPIAVAMVGFVNKDNSDPKTLFLILLAIVWGAGLGGFGTPLGGAMNLVAIKHIEAFTGQEYMYITWTAKMLPYLIVLAVGTCVYLLFIKTETKQLEGSRSYFRDEYKKLGKASQGEIISLVLFCAAVVIAFARPLFAPILPEFKPFYAFLLFGMAAFVLQDKNKKPLMNWQLAAKSINWGLMILFSGGLAAGNLIISTGAAQSIADGVTSLSIQGGFAIAVIFIVLGMFLSNASSNTAATAVLIPIVFSAAVTMKADPLPFVYIAAAACNCAFILPTSIRAIPVGYGLDVPFMFRKGLAAVVICLVILIIGAVIVI